MKKLVAILCLIFFTPNIALSEESDAIVIESTETSGVDGMTIDGYKSGIFLFLNPHDCPGGSNCMGYFESFSVPNTSTWTSRNPIFRVVEYPRLASSRGHPPEFPPWCDRIQIYMGQQALFPPYEPWRGIEYGDLYVVCNRAGRDHFKKMLRNPLANTVRQLTERLDQAHDDLARLMTLIDSQAVRIQELENRK